MNDLDIRHVRTWGVNLEHMLGQGLQHKKKKLELEFAPESNFDMSSLFILFKKLHGFSLSHGLILDFSKLPKEFQTQFKKFEREQKKETVTQEETPSSFIHEVGIHTMEAWESTKNLLSFLGYILMKTKRIIVRHSSFPMASFFYHVDHSGIRAIPIVALISFLIGMVLAYQGINQLARFGAQIYTIDFLAVGVMREIGVLITAVVIAGRSASAYTAQIGTMIVNQEIDAMKIFQLDPVLYLVLPRILGLLVMLPILVFISDILALAGGMFTSQLVIDVSPFQFMQHLKKASVIGHFWVGMSKAPLFAFLISLVGCFRGFQVKKSAESVGVMTTRSVVEAIFLVIICNAFMSILYSYLKV